MLIFYEELRIAINPPRHAPYSFLQVLPTGLCTLVARAGEAPVVPPGMPQTTGEG